MARTEASLRGPGEFAKGRVRNGTERSEVRAEWSGVEPRPGAKLDRFEQSSTGLSQMSHRFGDKGAQVLLKDARARFKRCTGPATRSMGSV